MTRKTTIKVATLLSTVALATTAIGTYYLTNTTNTQTPIPTNAITTQTQQFEQDDLNVVTNDSSSMKLQVSRVNAQPSTVSDDVSTQSSSEFLCSSYVIVATLNPETTQDNENSITFTASWKNPSSNYANSHYVEDYITLKKNGYECTVSVKKAFSEEIVLTCYVIDNPQVQASCSVKFLKKVSEKADNDIYISDGGTGQNVIYLEGDTSFYLLGFDYTEGTEIGTLKYEKLYFELSDDVKTKVKSAASDYGSRWQFVSKGYNLTNSSERIITDTFTFPHYSVFVTYMGDPQSYQDAINESIRQALLDGGKIHAYCTVSYSYGGSTISTFTYSKDFSIYPTYLGATTTSIDLDSSAIIF